MVNIGLLGLGTVGSGVVEILDKKREELKGLTGHDIRVKKVLVNDPSKKRDVNVQVVFDFDEILKDEEIDIIVEVTGDVEKSYKYITEGLKAGKHIVTANKAVVSKYFEEFSNLANEQDLAFLYEASVGGGIPVLKPLKEQLLLNEVCQVQGILNGTCNYILTRMMDEGKSYDEILKSAQDMGYAEADPSADVDGYDTMRKLRILASLSLQGQINENDILMDGIGSISSFDIDIIKNMNYTVKLIGEARTHKDGYTAVVQPTILPRDNYFANVNMAYNSVAFSGSEVGELKFYGPGAGKLPTGNAVLSDVLDIVTGTYKRNNPLGTANLKNYNEEIKGTYYLRVSDADENILRSLRRIAKEMPSAKGQVAIITNEIGLIELKDLIDSLELKKETYFLGRIMD